MKKHEKEYIREQYEDGLKLIPVHMHEGIRNYMEKGWAPGGFLTAVLENNFKGVVSRADHINMRVLPEWAQFIYNYLPMSAQGSPEIVSTWLARGGLSEPDDEEEAA